VTTFPCRSRIAPSSDRSENPLLTNYILIQLVKSLAFPCKCVGAIPNCSERKNNRENNREKISDLSEAFPYLGSLWLIRSEISDYLVRPRQWERSHWSDLSVSMIKSDRYESERSHWSDPRAAWKRSQCNFCVFAFLIHLPKLPQTMG